VALHAQRATHPVLADLGVESFVSRIVTSVIFFIFIFDIVIVVLLRLRVVVYLHSDIRFRASIACGWPPGVTCWRRRRSQLVDIVFII
jgi:hypothetical protein